MISRVKNFFGAFRILEALSEAIESTKRLQKMKENMNLELLLAVEKMAASVDALREEEAALLSNLVRLREETAAAEQKLKDIRTRTGK